MTGKRHEGDRACCCDQADADCMGLAVRRLSQQRVHELAEEIWTASSGRTVPARPALDPRSSRPGASAQAAYRRRCQQDQEAWRLGWWWWAAAVATAASGGWLLGLAVGFSLEWPMTLTLALLTGWRLRFRPSASARFWRRQAALQRRTAGLLQPLEHEGYLVLHDITLPGWPTSLDHLLVGPTGVWVIASRWRGRPALPSKDVSRRRAHGAINGLVGGLRWEAAAIADALAGDAAIPVRPLLCVHGGIWPGGRRSVDGVAVVAPRELTAVVRQGSPPQPSKVDKAAARVIEVLRPAA